MLLISQFPDDVCTESIREVVQCTSTLHSLRIPSNAIMIKSADPKFMSQVHSTHAATEDICSNRRCALAEHCWNLYFGGCLK